ncbi:MAG: hypothetical protein AAF492_25415, partial [Verrucomicrobiota bacterium]
MKKYSIRGPDSGGKIDLVFEEYRPTPDRRPGNHPAISQDSPPISAPSFFPEQRAVHGLETIKKSVVADGIQAAIFIRRGEADGTFGKKGPTFRTGFSIERPHGIVSAAPEKNHAFSDHGMKRTIEGHAILPGPSGLRRMRRLINPSQA